MIKNLRCFSPLRVVCSQSGSFSNPMSSAALHKPFGLSLQGSCVPQSAYCVSHFSWEVLLRSAALDVNVYNISTLIHNSLQTTLLYTAFQHFTQMTLLLFDVTYEYLLYVSYFQEKLPLQITNILIQRSVFICSAKDFELANMLDIYEIIPGTLAPIGHYYENSFFIHIIPFNPLHSPEVGWHYLNILRGNRFREADLPKMT